MSCYDFFGCRIDMPCSPNEHLMVFMKSSGEICHAECVCRN